MVTESLTPLVDNLQAFRLKSRMQPITIMQCLSLDVGRFASQLALTIDQAPNLFKHALIVLDFSELAEPVDPDSLQQVVAMLKTHLLTPIGICNAAEAMNEPITQAGLPILSSNYGNRAQPVESSTARPTKIISKLIRSGQQIYAQQSDLVIIGSISAGAEVLADGNIHIYGTLNGRALAGVNDNQNAHIFCQHLNPELIAIAGQYSLPDQMPPFESGGAIHVFLENGRLRFYRL